MQPTHIPALERDFTSEQSILIDLDTVLDTRFGTLFQHSPLVAQQALRDKTYFSRQINDWKALGGLDATSFRRHYDERTWEVLKHSPPTGFLFALRTMIDDLAAQKVHTPFADEVTLSVNYFPYELHPLELEEMRKLVGIATGLTEKRVEMVSIPLQQLSPLLIRNRYTGMILYNFCEWMELQQDAFLKHNMPKIVVLAPALYRDRIPEQDEVAIKGFENLSPFELSEGALAGCFDLSFLDMKFFSAIPPEELAQASVLHGKKD